jgi:hypothetical protein
MIGTPYHISSVFCQFGYESDTEIPPQHFLTSLGLVTGKILDRIKEVYKLTPTSLKQIDEELLSLRYRLPTFYWHVDETAPKDQNEAFFWMTKVINRLHYYQVRIVLHTPFMIRSLVEPGYEFSRDACLSSARDLLDLFCLVRNKENELAYANKILDLYAFIATVVLYLGIIGNAVSHLELLHLERDWRTVNRTTEILKTASSQPFGKLALQSYQALERLIKFHLSTELSTSIRIMIPFVGIITVRNCPEMTDVNGGIEPAFEPWFLSSAENVFDRHLPDVQEMESYGADLVQFLNPAIPFSHELPPKYFDQIFASHIPAANIFYANDLQNLNSDSSLSWADDEIQTFF